MFSLDINECSEGTATCPRHAICKNTKGSYTCTCKNGYVVKDSKTCVKKGQYTFLNVR